MRLTRFLCKQKWRLHKKNLWHYRGTYKPQELPPSVTRLGVNPVDVHEYLYQKPEKWQPTADDPRFQHFREEIPDTEQPDYHEEILYQLSNSIKLSEGIKQAGLLTKTQTFDGLPDQIQALIGKTTIKNQDLLVQRAIYQSQVWDPTNERLPKHFDVENLKHKFRRFYGIPNGRSATILMNNLIRLARSLGGQYPSMVSERQYIFKPTVETVYRYKGLQVRVSGEYECLMLGKRPLQPFGNKDLIDNSVHQKLYDMYPILPTIDLVPYNRYTIREHTALKNTATVPARYPLTMFRTMNLFWKPEYKQAYNLLLCFAVAAQEARRIYGPDVKTLPKPITIKNINMDWTTLNFLCFQLNTLDTDSDDGVKNFAWCDTDNKMFVKNYPKPWREEKKWQSIHYEDYSPEVFEKFLAVFLHGALEVQNT